MAKVAQAAQATSPCEQGGDELLPFVVPMKVADSIDFEIFICKTNARVKVFLDDQAVVDEQGTSHIRTSFHVTTPGQHILRWGVSRLVPRGRCVPRSGSTALRDTGIERRIRARTLSTTTSSRSWLASVLLGKSL